MWKMIRRKACIDFTGRSWNLFLVCCWCENLYANILSKQKLKSLENMSGSKWQLKSWFFFFFPTELRVWFQLPCFTSLLFFFLKKLSEDHQPRVALTWGMAVFFSNSHQTHRSGLPCLKTFWVLAFFTIRSYETLSVTLRAVLLAALFFFFSFFYTKKIWIICSKLNDRYNFEGYKPKTFKQWFKS